MGASEAHGGGRGTTHRCPVSTLERKCSEEAMPPAFLLPADTMSGRISFSAVVTHPPCRGIVFLSSRNYKFQTPSPCVRQDSDCALYSLFLLDAPRLGLCMCASVYGRVRVRELALPRFTSRVPLQFRFLPSDFLFSLFSFIFCTFGQRMD